jgi:hypothetical protein
MAIKIEFCVSPIIINWYDKIMDMSKSITRNRFLQSRRATMLLVVLWSMTAVLLGFSYIMDLNGAGVLKLFWERSSITSIQPELGFAYTVPTQHPELSAHEHPSLAQVLEDGKPLPGPANAQHDDIRQVGQGSYSFWYDSVYFSTSDNSDPRTNGRQYEIRFLLALDRPIKYIIGGATALTVIAAFLLLWMNLLSLPSKQRGRSIIILSVVSFTLLGLSIALYQALADLLISTGRIPLLNRVGLVNIVNVLFVLTLIVAGCTFIAGSSTKKIRILQSVWVLVWGLLLAIQVYYALPYKVHTEVSTWWYIQTFDINKYEARGADYCGPAHIDTYGSSQYNYDKIAEARERVSDVIRSQALLGIFNKLTAGATTNTEKHLRVLQFVQELTFHSDLVPTYPDGEGVDDPLTLIELGDMWCGQGAKLAIDLFSVAGYPARMFQLGDHQVAEIYYDGGWHYFDTDVFGNGESVFKPDGTIPSVAELSQGQYYQRLDALASYQESVVKDCLGPSRREELYPSFLYFSANAYQHEHPGYYYKTASPEVADADTLQYGWLRYGGLPTKWVPTDNILLADYPKRYTPVIPTIQGLTFDKQTMTLKINFQSSDLDGDLIGYRVFVSNHSRGWEYNQFYGDESVKIYWANPDGWKPSMYENLFTLPPSDVTLITLQANETQVEIPVEQGKTYFITVMPFDAYGKMIGRILYPESNELKFEVK